MNDKEKLAIKTALFVLLQHRADAFNISGKLVKRTDAIDTLFAMLDKEQNNE